MASPTVLPFKSLNTFGVVMEGVTLGDVAEDMGDAGRDLIFVLIVGISMSGFVAHLKQ